MNLPAYARLFALSATASPDFTPWKAASPDGVRSVSRGHQPVPHGAGLAAGQSTGGMPKCRQPLPGNWHGERQISQCS
jgi:hypothetical protein